MHFDPVGDPTGQPAHRKQNGKHLLRYANRSVNDTGIEVDVRIEFLFDKVGIVQSDFFEFLSDLEERIVQLELGEQFIAGGFDD